jgi:S1-C subfamily serine protease
MAAPEPGIPGVRISVVTPGSFALSAGLQEGDVLLSLNTRRVTSQEMFVDAKRTLRPGMEVPVVIRRGDAVHTKYVTIGKKGEAATSRSVVNRNRVRPALNTERDAYPV